MQPGIAPADGRSEAATSPDRNAEEIARKHETCRGGFDTESAGRNSLQRETGHRCSHEYRYAFGLRCKQERE